VSGSIWHPGIALLAVAGVLLMLVLYRDARARGTDRCRGDYLAWLFGAVVAIGWVWMGVAAP
jgi:hypothetical protein